MIAFERLLLSTDILVYLPNLIVIVSLVSAAGLTAARLCRKGSAPLQHAILVLALALALASPLLVGIAQHQGIGQIRIALTLPEPEGGGEITPTGVAQETVLPAAAAFEVQLDPQGRRPTPTRFEPAVRIGGSNLGFADEAQTPVEPDEVAAPAETLSRSGLPANHTTPSPVAETTAAVVSPGPPWWRWVGSAAAYAWAAGICVGLMRLAKGILAVARLRRSFETPAEGRLQEAVRGAARTLRLPTPPTIRLSSLTPLPMALGFFRPVIVLPATTTEQLSRQQLTAILLHEVAHLARRDHWVGLLQQAVGILFWFHPLVRRISNHVGELREDICDNYVLQAQGDGAGLAKVLVEAAARVTAECRLPSTIGVLKPNLGGLGGRVSRLIDKNRSTNTRLSHGSAAILVIFGVAGLTATLLAGGLHVAQAWPLAKSEAKAEEAVVTELPSRQMAVRIVDHRGQPLAGSGCGRVSAVRSSRSKVAPTGWFNSHCLRKTPPTSCYGRRPTATFRSPQDGTTPIGWTRFRRSSR